MTDIQASPYRRCHVITDTNKPQRAVSIQLKSATWRGLDDIAKHRGISRSALGRELIEKYVREHAG